MTHLETITHALEHALHGEPTPSFRSAEFHTTFNAMRELNASNEAHSTQAQFGRSAMKLLLAHYTAAMESERALAIMRDKGSSLC